MRGQITRWNISFLVESHKDAIELSTWLLTEDKYVYSVSKKLLEHSDAYEFEIESSWGGNLKALGKKLSKLEKWADE